MATWYAYNDTRVITPQDATSQTLQQKYNYSTHARTLNLGHYNKIDCFTGKFPPKACVCLICDLFIINLCLFKEGCICFCLCSSTIGLVSQAIPFLFLSADSFEYSYPIGAAMEACETHLSFEFASWQNISLHTSKS